MRNSNSHSIELVRMLQTNIASKCKEKTSVILFSNLKMSFLLTSKYVCTYIFTTGRHRHKIREIGSKKKYYSTCYLDSFKGPEVAYLLVFLIIIIVFAVISHWKNLLLDPFSLPVLWHDYSFLSLSSSSSTHRRNYPICSRFF